MLPVFHRGDVVRKLRQAQGWRQGTSPTAPA